MSPTPSILMIGWQRGVLLASELRTSSAPSGSGPVNCGMEFIPQTHTRKRPATSPSKLRTKLCQRGALKWLQGLYPALPSSVECCQCGAKSIVTLIGHRARYYEGKNRQNGLHCAASHASKTSTMSPISQSLCVLRHVKACGWGRMLPSKVFSSLEHPGWSS